MVVYITYLCNVVVFLADPQLHVAYVIASYYFALNFGIASYLLYTPFLPADLSLAARTVHNADSYNFSVSSCKQLFIVVGALGSNKLILFLRNMLVLNSTNIIIAAHKQTLYIQHSWINFPELRAHSWNSGKIVPRENNLLYGVLFFNLSSLVLPLNSFIQ